MPIIDSLTLRLLRDACAARMHRESDLKLAEQADDGGVQLRKLTRWYKDAAPVILYSYEPSTKNVAVRLLVHTAHEGKPQNGDWHVVWDVAYLPRGRARTTNQVDAAIPDEAWAQPNEMITFTLGTSLWKYSLLTQPLKTNGEGVEVWVTRK